MVNLVLLGIEVDLGSVMPYGQAPRWFYEARQDGEAVMPQMAAPDPAVQCCTREAS
jgi:hypothetical protein